MFGRGSNLILQFYSQVITTRGVNVGGCGGVVHPPQRNDPVGLKLRAVGLKIMRLFTCIKYFRNSR